MRTRVSIQNRIHVSANNLRKVRTNLKFSQSFVAELAGITDRQYRNIELGKMVPNLKTALLICKALGETDITLLFQLQMDKDARNYLSINK